MQETNTLHTLAPTPENRVRPYLASLVAGELYLLMKYSDGFVFSMALGRRKIGARVLRATSPLGLPGAAKSANRSDAWTESACPEIRVTEDGILHVSWVRAHSLWLFFTGAIGTHGRWQSGHQ